jgi:hypothetical protein
VGGKFSFWLARNTKSCAPVSSPAVNENSPRINSSHLPQSTYLLSSYSARRHHSTTLPHSSPLFSTCHPCRNSVSNTCCCLGHLGTQHSLEKRLKAHRFWTTILAVKGRPVPLPPHELQTILPLPRHVPQPTSPSLQRVQKQSTTPLPSQVGHSASDSPFGGPCTEHRSTRKSALSIPLPSFPASLRRSFQKYPYHLPGLPLLQGCKEVQAKLLKATTHHSLVPRTRSSIEQAVKK